MRGIMLRLIVLLAAVASTACAGWRDDYAPRWCTGVCEVYAAQIELAKEQAAPNADAKAMKDAERRAWATLRRAEWGQASHDVNDLRCAAGLPSCRLT
jgi:hypothetical protein